MFKEPKYRESAFTCPWCGAYAQQSWDRYAVIQSIDKHSYLMEEENYYDFCKNGWNIEDARYLDLLGISTCKACGKYHVWNSEKMIFPQKTDSSIPIPLEDMPQVVKDLYLEARDVHPISYKASCALLRLALQHLCEELLKDRSTGEINKDIGELVKEAVPQEFQQALDIVRVIGNNAVHPGKMDESDVEEYAITLFELLNYIVQEKIVRPKIIGGIYNKLPSGVLKQIERRDNKDLVTSK